MMRVIVTNMPRNVSDCLFSKKTEDGNYVCTLDNNTKCNYPYYPCMNLEKDARYR